MDEYFQAKRELLMEGDPYWDMVATYPDYWSGWGTSGRDRSLGGIRR